MANHLIVYGHGGIDPGAIGNGTNERDFNRKILHPYIKKWTDKSKDNFTFYDVSGSKNLYAETANGWGLYSMTSKSYASITELHEDAAASSAATGGHTIVNSSFLADKHDLSLASIINKIVGWWGSVKNSKGISYRNNLLNCNVAANRGINYRLMELGFITNSSDMSKIRNNLDAYARGIVEGITGETLGDTTAKQPSTPSTPKTAFKVGDKVKIVDALYKDSAGADRSIVSRGKIGTIDRDVKKGKRYHVKGNGFSGWAHENDIELVKDTTTTFDINNYHTTKFAQIKLIKDDYAYKEVSLKNRVGNKIKKGTVLTVVAVEYNGKYPRFKLKSGLYITTRKDTVAKYK